MRLGKRDGAWEAAMLRSEPAGLCCADRAPAAPRRCGTPTPTPPLWGRCPSSPPSPSPSRPCVCRGVPRAGHAPGRGERVRSSEQGQAASLCPSGTARPAPGAAPAPPPGSPAAPGKGKRAKLTNATLRLVSLRTRKDWGKGENQATPVSCLETSCESLSFTRHSHQRPPCPLPSSF